MRREGENRVRNDFRGFYAINPPVRAEYREINTEAVDRRGPARRGDDVKSRASRDVIVMCCRRAVTGLPGRIMIEEGYCAAPFYDPCRCARRVHRDESARLSSSSVSVYRRVGILIGNIIIIIIVTIIIIIIIICSARL